MAVELGSAYGKIDIDVSGVQKAANSAKSMIGGVGKTTKAAFGGVATGVAGGIAAVGVGAAQVSTQTQQAAADIQASLGVSQGAAEEFAAVARNIYGNNFAGSVNEAGEAVGLMAQQMGLAADNPALQSMTERALALQDTFGVGVGDSIDAAKTLMDNFGLSSAEAFDMLAGGYQMGLDRSGDFLDTIGEYSVQFSEGGANASQFFSMLESGMAGGMLGTDKAADAFKEFRLRIQDGSDSTAEALAAIGLDADAMAAGFADGSLTATTAFAQVQAALKNTDDENVQFQAGVALMGSQFEDMGAQAVLGMSTASVGMAALSGAADSLDAKYATAGATMAGMWREITVAAAPATDAILAAAVEAMPAFQSMVVSLVPIVMMLANHAARFVGVLAGWMEGFSQLDPQLQTIVVGAGGFLAALVPLGMVIGPIVTAVGALASGAAALASPLIIIPALIGGLLAILFDWGGANERVAATLEGWGLEGIANGVRALHEGVEGVMGTIGDLLSGDKTLADVFDATVPEWLTTLFDWAWPEITIPEWIQTLFDWAWPLLGPIAWIVKLTSWAWPTLNKPNWIESLLNFTWPSMPKLPGWMGGGGGDAGENASGTPFWKGGRTWVGEEGPELIDLPTGTRIHDNPTSMAMASGMGGGVTININNPVVRSEQDINRIAEQVVRKLQQRQRYG